MYNHHGKEHPGSQRGPLETSLISSFHSVLINSTNRTGRYLQEQAATSIQDILCQLNCSAAFPDLTQAQG